jgi:tRNA(fMet)-specific endonuclease VapC
MKICIDTNAYTAFKKNNPAVIALLEEVEHVFVPAIALGELYAGFFMGSNTNRNIQELNAFLKLTGVEVASVTDEIAEQYGWIVKNLKEKGTPIPTNDIWIAATTLATGSKLVSYDQHYKHIPNLMVYAP